MVNKPKIALEAEHTFLYRNLHSFCSPVAKKRTNQKKSSSCSIRLRPMRIFSNVCLFMQTLQVFVTGGKRSSRWLLAFGWQPESKTWCFVKLFLRDLSTADDSGSAPAFARVFALVNIYFCIECVGKVTRCCKVSKFHCGFSKSHSYAKVSFFVFLEWKCTNFLVSFRGCPPTHARAKNLKERNQKINVSIYVKSVVLASSLEIAEQHRFFFLNI